MARFGQVETPPEIEEAQRRARRIEWLSIGYTACTVTLVAFVVGNSQAMRTAWIEDMLSTLPQIAFLVALPFIKRPPSHKHPYGMHRAMGVGHLAGGVALLIVGALLAYESVSGLLTAHHPTIGTVQVFGTTVWLGWLMIGVMVPIAVAPFWFARVKRRLAEELNNKLLYADAAMSRADWQTNAASIVGVLGIGFGLWWLDSVAAAFISAGILWDGATNTRSAVLALTDMRATTVDQDHPEPLIDEIEAALLALDWVSEVGVRVRDMGQVLHVEAFVVPEGDSVSLHEIEEASHEVAALDWSMQDVAVIPVDHLPEELDVETKASTARD